jgi:hypothetical protein
MQKTVGFYLVKASLHFFLMPAASTGISPYHPSTVEFSPDSSQKKVQGVFLLSKF